MINIEIYLSNLRQLEDQHADLISTFETHDDWVDFIANKLQEFANEKRSRSDNIDESK